MIYFWAIVIVIIYTYIYYTDPNRKIDKMIPGPFRVPFLGNTLIFLRSPKSLYKLIFDLAKRYNYKTFRIWFLHKPLILVTDYKVAKMILSNPSLVNKTDEYRFFEPWLGENFIFTGPEKPWKRARKVITPVFHFNILTNYFETFYKNSEILSEKLEKYNWKGTFDIYENIVLYALDNVCDTVFGVNMQAQNNPDSKYLKALKGISKVIYYRAVLPWLRSDTIFNMSSLCTQQKKCLDILHGYSNEIVRQRKCQLINTKVRHDENENSLTNQKTAFLDSLLENAQTVGFTDEEIRQTVDGVVFAGHDTVAAGLGFLFYVLAEHQDVQEKVYEELERIFQNSDECPTFNDLQQMKYTEQVIKETLRLHAVAPCVGRKLNEDLYISENQYIPKNMNVTIIVSAIHRDPEIWLNPDKFDPDRFSPENSQNRDPYTFLAFSAGPRNCVGIKYAMFEIKITLYSVLRKFRLSLNDNPKDKMTIQVNFINTSANGIRIKLESRKRTASFL